MTEPISQNNDKERYCSYCGISLIPLDKPYISRECDECGKEIHFVRRGPDGKGIKIEAGEKFNIPSGFIKFSLDPSTGGHLYKPGVQYVVKQFLISGLAKKVEDLQKMLEQYISKADIILENSELLKDFNLNDKEDNNKAFKVLQKNQDSQEWFAMLLGSYCEIVKEAIEEDDINKAIWAMSHASVIHSLTVVSEPIFRQTLWRGYLANQTIYEVASAASNVPGEAEAIKELQKLFNKLDEVTLHTYVESGLPIGPRIGVSKLPEPLILALAKFHLAGYEREREEKRRDQEKDKFNRQMKIKWCGIGIAATSVIITILKTIGIL